jgi:hypothetical protein
VLKKLNPLALSIRVPARSKGAEPIKVSPIPSQIVYNRVLAYLGKLAEAEWRTKEHPILARFSRGSDLVSTFKNQFHSYSLLRYPFDKPLAPGQSVRSWWCSFLEHPEANVLAVSPYFLVLRMLCRLTTHQVHRQETLLRQAKLHARRTHGIRVHTHQYSSTQCSGSSDTG